MLRKAILVFALILLLCLVVVPAFAQDEFVFGVILVGPKNDRGWSQSHYEGGLYVEQTVPGSRMLLFESLNPADSPETTLLDVVSTMVDEGAKLIITTSDAFEADTDLVAVQFPDVVFINSTGDTVLEGTAPSNVGNFNGQLEWNMMIGGCAASLVSESGNIGYLGALINHETRRLAASAFLGARYCYENYKGGTAADLQFNVQWIGFWFNIPGVTLDPSDEANTFFDNGADVVISGIDTTEALVVANQRAERGETVWAVPHGNANACNEAPAVCLGVPFHNWGPPYKTIAESVIAGTWEQSWDWQGPDWSDINNIDTSTVGFTFGTGLSEEQLGQLNEFVAEMTAFATDEANGDTLFLWEGPLNLQDGTALAPEGEFVTPFIPPTEGLSVWYLEQLLEGMNGASTLE